VICPDLYIDYGGSQYINSSWIGNHADHILQELIPYVEQNFPVKKGFQHRAALGRSSGGFGALRFALDFDGSFAAIACHAGDMGFEWTYRRSLIDICTGLYKFQDPVIWLKELKKQKKLSGFDTHVLMMLGMSAFYSPNPSNPAGFDLPITLRNGELTETVWNRWMAHDPIEIVNNPTSQDRLGKLKALFIDCGNRDQYFLQFGGRQFSAKLKELGIKHNYSEFDDNHSGTAYRYDESLPLLLAAIS
jgi:enterochelin esterase family protein